MKLTAIATFPLIECQVLEHGCSGNLGALGPECTETLWKIDSASETDQQGPESGYLILTGCSG